MTTRRGRALDELVAGLDPEAGRARPELDERAHADLAHILASRGAVEMPSTRHSGGMPSLRSPLVLGAAAALAVLLTVVWPAVAPGSRSVAFAATPAPLAFRQLPERTDPTILLEQLARQAASLPDQRPDGRYAHSLVRSWSLFTSVDGRRGSTLR